MKPLSFFVLVLSFLLLLIGCDNGSDGNSTLFAGGSSSTPVVAPPTGTGGAGPNLGVVSVAFSTGTDPVIVEIGNTGLGIATAVGTPPGGVFSLGTQTTATTGGTFAINASAGLIDFTGFTSAGQATVVVNYTAGVNVNEVFTVIVPLSFSPASPGSAFVGGGDQLGITTALGFPTGGTFSIATQSAGGTGGTFAIDTASGVIDFNGPFTATGTATADVQYVSSLGTFNLTYTVDVSNAPTVMATPASPQNVYVGGPDLAVSCVGSPAGGTFSLVSPVTGGTGGTFSIDPTTGDLDFTGPFTATGIASVTVDYDTGAVSATLNYTVFVVRGLILTAVFDGARTGQTPKGIELYVNADIADLSIFAIGCANNGGGTDGIEFTFPADTATAGSYIYVGSETTEFTTFFGFAPDYVSSTGVGVNGDDAMELFQSGSVIDTFGEITYATAPTFATWNYDNSWGYRNDATGPDGSTFIIGNWSFGGSGAIAGSTTTNATASVPIPIGTYTP